MPRRRRPLRPLLEGVHAGDGRGRPRRARRRAAAQPLHRRDRRRRHAHEPPGRPAPSAPRPTTSSVPSSTASAPTAPSARTRTRSRSSASRRRCYAQGYFVYDSKKSGSTTISHLRFAPAPDPLDLPDRSDASFVACHQFGLLERVDVLGVAAPGATFLLNSPYGPDEVWDELPHEVQRRDRRRRGSASTSSTPTRSRARPGSGSASTPCSRPASSRSPDVLPARRGDRRDQGRDREELREAAARSCSSATSPPSTARSTACTRSRVPAETGNGPPSAAVPTDAPDFVQRRHRAMIAGEGDLLPVSGAPGRRHVPDRHGALREALDRRGDPDLGPVDLHRLREVRARLPARGDPDEGLRPGGARAAHPTGSSRRSGASRELPGMLMTIQVAPDDCTGLRDLRRHLPGAVARRRCSHKSIDLEPKLEHLERGARRAATSSSSSADRPHDGRARRR